MDNQIHSVDEQGGEARPPIEIAAGTVVGALLYSPPYTGKNKEQISADLGEELKEEMPAIVEACQGEEALILKHAAHIIRDLETDLSIGTVRVNSILARLNSSERQKAGAVIVVIRNNGRIRYMSMFDRIKRYALEAGDVA